MSRPGKARQRRRSNSTPVVARNYVIVGANDGSVVALPTACNDITEGCDPAWTARLGGAVRSSPAVANDMVYVGSDDGFVYGMQLKCRPDCAPLWASSTRGPVRSSPAVTDGMVVAASLDGTLRAWSLPQD